MSSQLNKLYISSLLKERIDNVIITGIKEKIYPGANLLVGLGEDILYEKAYGTIDDLQEASLETMYDLASLTKVIATTTAIMRLFEEGKFFFV